MMGFWPMIAWAIYWDMCAQAHLIPLNVLLTAQGGYHGKG